MTTQELRDIIAETGWWVRPRAWALQDFDLRRAADAPFDYSSGALDGLVRGGLYILRGPRRVGKSVEVKKKVRSLVESGENPRLIVHIAADDLAGADLRRAVRAANEITPAGPRHWFIDEITAIRDGWPPVVKWLRDNDPRFAVDTVVLTGSSAAGLSEAVKALAGRRGDAPDSDRVLLPMSFRDFFRVRCGDERNPRPPPPDDLGPLAIADMDRTVLREAVRVLAPWLPRLIDEWETYLHVGGFPQSVATHDRGNPDAIRHSLLHVIEGEAFRQARWPRSQTLAFLQRLTQGIASPTNLQDVAMDIGGRAKTVGRRVAALREAFVAWPCYPERDLRPLLRAQPKTYFTDPVYAHLSPHSGVSVDRGQLSEQQLGMTLVRSFARHDPGGYLDFDSVLHHRTRSRREIDFVGREFGDIAVESKYVDGDRWRRDARTLRASRWRGIMATRGALDLRDPDLLAVPAGLLAWLIGP